MSETKNAFAGDPVQLVSAGVIALGIGYVLPQWLPVWAVLAVGTGYMAAFIALGRWAARREV